MALVHGVAITSDGECGPSLLVESVPLGPRGCGRNSGATPEIKHGARYRNNRIDPFDSTNDTRNSVALALWFKLSRKAPITLNERWARNALTRFEICNVGSTYSKSSAQFALAEACVDAPLLHLLR
jgi:hypothetical protein